MSVEVTSSKRASISAYAGSILFVALFASDLAGAPTSPLLDMASHLILLPVIATLPAPAWARAAGYGWDRVVEAIDGLYQALAG